MRSISLARVQQEREVKRRQEECFRADIVSYYGVQKSMHAASCAAERGAARGQSLESRRAQQEQLAAAAAQQAEGAREVQRMQMQQREEAAQAAEAAALADLSGQRQVQAVREQSEDLRLLRSAVNEAKAAMQRRQQEEDQRLLKAEEVGYNLALDGLMEAERQQALEAVKRDEEINRCRGAQSLQALQEQMAERTAAHANMQTQVDREKVMIEAIVARIEAEDAATADLKRQRQAQLSQSLQDQQRQRAALHLEARQAEATEEKRRQEYIAAKQALDENEVASKAAKRERADWAYDQLKQQKEEEDRRREEEKDLINLLRSEEAAERDRQATDAARARQEKLRIEMLLANQEMLRLKEERAQQAKQEEQRLRQEMLAEMAAQERLEQMGAQRARLRRAEHAREVERQLQQKRMAEAAAQAQELAAETAQQIEGSKRAAILMEERLKLLREAAAVRQCLPAGTLSTDDLTLMQQAGMI